MYINTPLADFTGGAAEIKLTITKPQQFGHERLGIERIQILESFAVSQEHDGASRGGHGAQRPSPLGVAVQLGHDHAPDLDRAVKRQRLIEY